MARSNNCVNMNVNHIQWRSDSLVYYFGTSKGNQTGDTPNDPWRGYSNPKNPTIFLFSLWLSTSSLIPTSWPPIPSYFQVTISMKDFWSFSTKSLTEILKNFIPLELRKELLDPTMSGKDQFSIVASCCTVSPPMAYICVRACWSMGPIKYRYIHYEKAGDQFVGRSVTFIYFWQQNLGYPQFIGIVQTHLWAQKMKWWLWLNRISWEEQMFIFQP